MNDTYKIKVVLEMEFNKGVVVEDLTKEDIFTALEEGERQYTKIKSFKVMGK
jgi:hypothetical protein